MLIKIILPWKILTSKYHHFNFREVTKCGDYYRAIKPCRDVRITSLISASSLFGFSVVSVGAAVPLFQ